MENTENNAKNQNAGDEEIRKPVNLLDLGFKPGTLLRLDENGNFSVPLEEVCPKRNCGKTGPVTSAGRQISSMNAIRHGCCATTLILENERQEDYDEIQNRWLALYGSPDEKSVLYSFIVKTSQSEWFRIRAQREYDYFFEMQHAPMADWTDAQMKRHDLLMRYMTAAERKFQREYRMLEHHWKTHHKPAAVAAVKPEPAPAEARTDSGVLPIYFLHNHTGQISDANDNMYPAPPDYVPKKIIPGEFDDNHPVNLAKKLPERRR